MRVIDPGHVYELQHLDSWKHLDDKPHSVLKFVKRMGPKFPGNTSEHAGTNLQEVLRACIERLRYLYNQVPCWETRACIWLLETAIGILESRASRRHNLHLELSDLDGIETQSTCILCGHIQCKCEDSTLVRQPSNHY